MCRPRRWVGGWLLVISLLLLNIELTDPDEGLCDGTRGRDYVLQGVRRHLVRGGSGRLWSEHKAAGRHHAQERPRHQESRGHPVRQGEHRRGNAGERASWCWVRVTLLSSLPRL